MTVNYLDKFKGTLVGLEIGDILGYPLRNKTRNEIVSEFNYFATVRDLDDFETFLLKNKKKFDTHTNNTQLAFHIAEALIEANGYKIKSVLKQLLFWLDDPPIGSCYGTFSTIKKIKKGRSWNQASSHSGGSGTLSRVAPIGLFYHTDPYQLVQVAKKSSLLTHTHPATTIGTIIIARAIAYLISKSSDTPFSIDEFSNTIASSFSDLKNIDQKIQEQYTKHLYKMMMNLSMSVNSGLIKFSQIGVKTPYFIEEYFGKAFVHPYAMSTVICSLFLFLKNRSSYKECLFNFVTAGGGSTVGALGGALAGAYFGYSKMPDPLLKLVKNLKYPIKIAIKLFNAVRPSIRK
jgi:poly(ADP-ribose) glycohydrolase ARH3